MKFNAHHRISLTHNGFGYLATMLVLYMFSINYSSNLLFSLCFIFTGIFVICFWFNYVNVKSIKSKGIAVQYMHQQQAIKYELEVSDEGRRHHYDLFVKGESVVDIKKSESQVWKLVVKTENRGLKKAEPLWVVSRWPLGLFKSSSKFSELPSVVVYPKISGTTAIKQSIHSAQAHQSNDADSLLGLREYQLGDSTRRIDWRAMARREVLHVKLFDGGTSEASVFLKWQDTAHMDYELRISSLCRWVLDYQKEGLEFGLKLPGFSVAPANSYAHVHQCLYQLAMMPAKT